MFGKVREGKQNKPLQSTSSPVYSQLSCVMALGFVCMGGSEAVTPISTPLLGAA